MRHIQEIPHEKFKINVFSWNNKYIIKFENTQFEQTYKIKEWELTSQEEISQVIDLIAKNIEDIFNQMSLSLTQALDTL